MGIFLHRRRGGKRRPFLTVGLLVVALALIAGGCGDDVTTPVFEDVGVDGELPIFDSRTCTPLISLKADTAGGHSPVAFGGSSGQALVLAPNNFVGSVQCWDAEAGAVFAEQLAQVVDYEIPRDAYLAGLLHDFGQVVFDARHHEQYVEVMSENSEAEIVNREIQKFGTSHSELGADIIEG